MFQKVAMSISHDRYQNLNFFKFQSPQLWIVLKFHEHITWRHKFLMGSL